MVGNDKSQRKKSRKPTTRKSGTKKNVSKSDKTKSGDNNTVSGRKKSSNKVYKKNRHSSKIKGRGYFWFIRRTIYWSMVLGIWCLIIFSGVLAYHAAFLPPSSEWRIPERPPNVTIISVEGHTIANRGETGGEPIKLDEIPDYLPQAVIAIEDRRFHFHPGIDPIGLTRAMVNNAIEGRIVQGGSSLTQQLAKNLFLKPERTLSRKMQELVLSFWLEISLTKEEILTLYLNRVYLGNGAYGIDAASRRYFRKPARDVSLSEAAMLAGLLKAPSRYSPSRDLELARFRAELVLQAMNREGYITESEMNQAINQPAKVASRFYAGSFNYAADWVMERLPGFIGSIDEDIYVDTTIDRDLQLVAEGVLRDVISKDGRKFRVSQGAIVSINTSGAVRVLIGGRNYSESQFNRAVLARRQPGSAFKPFVFLTAIERGLTPYSMRIDQRISINGWSPANYTDVYLGPVSMTQALAESINTVAAKLAFELGPDTVIRTANRLGVYSPLNATPSIALGTSEVTPFEITTAFVPFSNGGFGVVPYVIRRIRTKSGKILFERKGSGPGRVVDTLHVGMMNQMMTQTIQSGTGKSAKLENWPAAGKTGTSQNFRDAWFIGYTAELTTGVWLGNDNNSPTRKATGGELPAKIWQMYMEVAHRGLTISELPGTDLVPAETTQENLKQEEPPSAIGNFFRKLFGG